TRRHYLHHAPARSRLLAYHRVMHLSARFAGGGTRGHHYCGAGARIDDLHQFAGDVKVEDLG
ncbi:hypothetical protein, partial [Mycobacterium avium]|uniref:hypothetical protein n=1 Tax=Mycobacterium avium TaxID=1764 RepID=UPI001C0A8424